MKTHYIVIAAVVALQVSNIGKHCASSHATATAGSRKAIHSPRYRLFILPTPKGWDRLNLQGITDSGIIYGTLEHTGDQNSKSTTPFTLIHHVLKIAPNHSDAGAAIDKMGGLTVTVRSVSSIGEVQLLERYYYWNGAWMGWATETWVHTATFAGCLPGVDDDRRHDITNCWITKDNTVFGTCALSITTDATDNTYADPKTHAVCIWKSGKLIRSMPGDFVGIETSGKMYIRTADGKGYVLDNKDATPALLSSNDTPDSITPGGWLVKSRTPELAAKQLISVTNGKVTLQTTFIPQDISKAGVVVGPPQEDIERPEKALVQVGGKAYDLNRCVVNVPHSHYLTQAFAINSRNWILAKLVTNSSEDAVAVRMVLLKPIGE